MTSELKEAAWGLELQEEDKTDQQGRSRQGGRQFRGTEVSAA